MNSNEEYPSDPNKDMKGKCENGKYFHRIKTSIQISTLINVINLNYVFYYFRICIQENFGISLRSVYCNHRHSFSHNDFQRGSNISMKINVMLCKLLCQWEILSKMA